MSSAEVAEQVYEGLMSRRYADVLRIAVEVMFAASDRPLYAGADEDRPHLDTVLGLTSGEPGGGNGDVRIEDAACAARHLLGRFFAEDRVSRHIQDLRLGVSLVGDDPTPEPIGRMVHARKRRCHPARRAGFSSATVA